MSLFEEETTEQGGDQTRNVNPASLLGAVVPFKSRAESRGQTALLPTFPTTPVLPFSVTPPIPPAPVTPVVRPPVTPVVRPPVTPVVRPPVTPVVRPPVTPVVPTVPPTFGLPPEVPVQTLPYVASVGKQDIEAYQTLRTFWWVLALIGLCVLVLICLK